MKPAIKEVPLPKYIAIEGPIGVGKTTLANKIATTFNYDALLEQPAENPFLKNFYRNPSQSALATQLFFLFQRRTLFILQFSLLFVWQYLIIISD